ncbi:MAG: lytic transglycosylase domain-containing protein [Polyangiaceae bacterium]|nr:lytic transglycosylase domain-containing protein [Polyangiaceae bacterium]
MLSIQMSAAPAPAHPTHEPSNEPAESLGIRLSPATFPQEAICSYGNGTIAQPPDRNHVAPSPSARSQPLRSRATLPVIFGASLLLASSAQADIQTSVDESGVVSISNSRRARRVSDPRPNIVMPGDDSPERHSRYEGPIREASRLYQIPEPLIRAVIKVESDFDPRAVSPANAQGLMQLIPATAERMLITDVFEPRQNILGGTRYLRILANLFNGDLQLTVAAYNAGEGAVMRYGGIPPYPETQAYVSRVVGYYQEYRLLPRDTAGAASAP